jgi:hypothetical protein
VPDALADRLRLLAETGRTESYGAMARALGMRLAALTAALEATMAEDARQGQPLRAALLAARLSPQGLPAPGFFQAARALGYRIDDPAAFVAAQRAALNASASPGN